MRFLPGFSLSLLRLVACVCLLASAPFGYAQENNIGEITQRLERTNKTIDFIKRVVDSANGDDDALIGARSKLLDIRPQLDEAMAPINDRLNVLNESITKLGPAPDDPSTEDITVTEERQRLTNERSELQVVVNRREDLRGRIGRNVDRISSLRSAAFTTTITKRTPISTDLFSSLGSDTQQVVHRVQQILSNWVLGLWNGAPGKLGLAFIASLLAAGGFGWLTRHVIRQDETAEPTRFRLLSAALVRTLVPTLMLGLALFAFFGVLSVFGLFPINVQQIVSPVAIACLSYFFVTALTNNIFSPDNSGMRLVPFSAHAASRMSILIMFLAGIQALDHIVSSVSKSANAPLTVTIANSFVAALLIGLVLIALLLVRKDKDTTQRAVPRWARFPILLVAVGIIVAAFAGYVGLSRFAAQQIVVSGALLVTIYLGLIAANELGQTGGLSSTRFGGWLATNRNASTERLDQYGLMLSLLFSGLTLVIGLPALAMQWGSRFDDVWTFLKQLFLGFQLGNFNFSLAYILLGLGVFLFVFFITKLLQRWLSRSVLSRTKADIGVRNSITTGIGYMGIAIAALLGITAAGFNLASLAIVAGALSLGIGFGLQNVVSNFVSGLILLVERPIKVGDFIETSSHVGTIKKISVRATELETIHSMSVIVPNSELINSPVGNWTHKMKNGRIDIPVGVAYGSDYKKVRELLLKVTEAQPEIQTTPEPFVYFVGFGASSVDFELRVHLRDRTRFPIIRSELLFDICDIFAEHDIEIPFPQTDLHIRSVDPDAAKALSGKPPAKRKPKAT